ncbi:MAG: hypothetical protein JWP87_1003 [Labilithrix sp.]|jgi:hypothetical protein|nr:hypothetical protein [Labilithrix sp.]
MTTKSFLILLASLPFTLTSAACTHAPGDDDSTVAATDDSALTTAAPSGYPECTGTGWTTTIAEWRGVRGSYMRSGFGLAAPGVIASLTVSADPATTNQGMPSYVRTVDNHAQTGRVELGVDNPAIGPAIRFLDEASQPRDIFFVLAKKKTTTGKVGAICLVKAGGAPGEVLGPQRPFMLSRVGL